MQSTKRDLELFKSLQSYGLLTTSQITGLYFGGIATTTVLRRLRILEKAGFLRRIALSSNGAVAWALTQRAAESVSQMPARKSFRPDLLTHDLKLVEVQLAFEEAQIARSWISEHEIRHKVFKANSLKSASRILIPDAIMGVESVRAESLAVAVELELNFKNASRYKEIFWEYKLRENLSAVLYIVSDPGIGKAALNAWQQVASLPTQVQFYFADLTETLNKPGLVTLHGERGETPISDVWKSYVPSSSAQAAAQPMSSLQIEKRAFSTGDKPW
jgi:hypothetical protein